MGQDPASGQEDSRALCRESGRESETASPQSFKLKRNRGRRGGGPDQ